MKLTIKTLLITSFITLLFIGNAQALDCAEQAGITAIEFFNLSEADRKKVNAFTCYTHDGTACRYILVKDGKPAFKPPYHVKFSELYNQYLSALDNREPQKIQDFYTNLAPTDKPADNFFMMMNLIPPGGFAKAKVLAGVFEYKKFHAPFFADQLDANPEFFILFLFDEMGGDIIAPVHVVKNHSYLALNRKYDAEIHKTSYRLGQGRYEIGRDFDREQIERKIIYEIEEIK